MDNRTVLPLIEMRRSDIAEICRRFLISRLDVFGSAERGSDFDPDRLDVDLLVSYDASASRPTLEEFSSFANSLKLSSDAQSIS